jgi:hypothetical protein
LTDQLALLARADNTYVGSRTDETYSINQLPSYDLTNIRAGLDGGRWSAVLFVNNVADKRALLNNITQDAVNLATLQSRSGESAAHGRNRLEVSLRRKVTGISSARLI